jgi:hypothetical protein
MKTILVAFMAMGFAVSASATTSGKVCKDSEKASAAAESAFPKSEEASGSDPRYVSTNARGDHWDVDVVYHDQCYLTVSVLMKTGTCTVMGLKKGQETCTDD